MRALMVVELNGFTDHLTGFGKATWPCQQALVLERAIHLFCISSTLFRTGKHLICLRLQQVMQLARAELWLTPSQIANRCQHLLCLCLPRLIPCLTLIPGLATDADELASPANA